MRKIFLTMMILMSSMTYAEVLNVKVKGMVCAFCANGLEKKFKKLDGLKSVKVSLKTKLITAKFEGKVPLNNDELKKLIVDSGYNVASIERK